MYVVFKQHECESLKARQRVYEDAHVSKGLINGPLAGWQVSDGYEAITGIKYCPYCGIELKD